MKTLRYAFVVILLLINLLLSGQLAVNSIFNSVTGPNSEPVAFNAINMNSFDLITSNVQFSEKNNVQKLLILPFKLLEDDPGSVLRNVKLNVAQKNGISTFGIGLGINNSSPFSKRGDKYFGQIQYSTEPIQGGDESDFAFQQRLGKYEIELYTEVAKYYEKLLKNSFQLTVGFNTSLFSVIGGDKIDLDNNGLIDNRYTVESYNYSLSSSFSFSSATGISAAVHYINKFESPEENQKRVPYIGSSFTFAHRLVILDKKYKTSKDYFKSLFVPSIILGFTIENLKAQDNLDFIEDNIIQRVVYTPFLDFKINPKNQFRIGIPIQKLKGNNDEVNLAPFIQYGISLSNLGK